MSGNLNNYTSPGIWYYDGNQSVANNPGDVAGDLEVIVTSACVIQRLTVYDTIITRRKIGSTWAAWVSYAKNSDLTEYYVKNEKISKVKWVYAEDSEGPYIVLHTDGKNIAFWRVSGTY